MTLTETWHGPEAQHRDDREDQQLAVLTETRDYTRRIHWWIRLFGVVWLTTMALGLLVGAALGILAVATVNDVSNNLGNDPDNTSSYSSRANCMAAPETTIAQCDAWFGTP